MREREEKNRIQFQRDHKRIVKLNALLKYVLMVKQCPGALSITAFRFEVY